MNFNSTRRKIRKTFERIQNNFNNLRVKFNLKKNFSLRTLDLKDPSTIYDSDWIESLPVVDNIVPEHDPNVFVLAQQATSFGSTKNNALHPAKISYNFELNLEIPEEFLPFLKTTILAKSAPTAELLSPEIFQYEEWNRSSTYEIKGDSTLIFTGTNVPTTDRYELSLEDLNNGASTESLTSKWFSGTLKYTYLGDNIVIIGKVHKVFAKYNFFVNGGGDNFDLFIPFAISNLSPSSVTGTGTFETIRWIETSPSVWELVVTTTKNVTMTAPFTSLSTITLYGAKTVNGTPVVGLTHTMPAGATVTEWDLTYQDFHRIFYSNKLARVFYVQTFENGAYRELANKPISSDYETATNPYSDITYKINEDPLPDSINAEVLSVTDETKSWLKITETDGLTTYTLKIIGEFYYKSPATEAVSQSFFAEDENYTNNGTSYDLDGENRDNKQKDAYFPPLLPIEVKLLVTVDAKLSINQTEHYS